MITSIQKFENIKAPAYMKQAVLIIMLLPLAQILEDILVLKVGPIFITPIKLVLLMGGLTFIKYLHPIFITSFKLGSPTLKLFFLYSIIQIFSLSYANSITFSQKINYLLFNTASIVIIYGMAKLFLKTNYNYFNYNFSLILKYIFYLSLLFSTFQLAFNDQFVLNIGNFKTGKGGLGVTGFNYERLFLCEFLTLGYGIILLQNANKLLSLKIILLGIWVFSIIVATDSFTGMIGFSCLLLCIPKIKMRYVLVLFLVMFINILLVLPFLKSSVFSSEQLRVREYRFQSYFKNYQTDNWRYLSTFAIISEVINNPTYFGMGFKENESYLSSLYDQFVLAKFGDVNKEEKRYQHTHSSQLCMTKVL